MERHNRLSDKWKNSEDYFHHDDVNNTFQYESVEFYRCRNQNYVVHLNQYTGRLTISEYFPTH